MDITECKDVKLRETKSDRENRLCEIYSRILYRNFELTSKAFISSVEEILNCGKELSVNDLNTTQNAFHCAYLFQLGVHDTCVVMQNFSEFIKLYPKAIDIVKNEKNINICCLGSSAIFEAVGICNVLDDILSCGCAKYICPKHVFRKSANIAFIGKTKELDSVSYEVLLSSNNYFHAVNLDGLLSLNHDFSTPFSEDVKNTIKHVPVVTMVKFLSSCTSSKVKGIIKETLGSMKRGGILFYLDEDRRGDYKTLSDYAYKSQKFIEVYRSPEPTEYCLEDEIIDVQRDLYFDSLVNSVKNSFQPTVSSAWIKCRRKQFLEFEGHKPA